MPLIPKYGSKQREDRFSSCRWRLNEDQFPNSRWPGREICGNAFPPWPGVCQRVKIIRYVSSFDQVCWKLVFQGLYDFISTKEKHSSYAIYIANIGSLSLLPFRHVFFFLETNYNRILGHRIEWWNCRTWGMKAWSAGSPFTPLPLDLYSFISASTPSSSLDTPIKSIISYIVRDLVLHFTDLF